jgi:hypothetical protein
MTVGVANTGSDESEVNEKTNEDDETDWYPVPLTSTELRVLIEVFFNWG